MHIDMMDVHKSQDVLIIYDHNLIHVNIDLSALRGNQQLDTVVLIHYQDGNSCKQRNVLSLP